MTKNLVLTGMMGVGKTTIGKSLAKRLSYKFVDMDKLIEDTEGCSINVIFKNKSENYFRKIETTLSLQALKKNKSIISLGGGAFLNSSIRKAVSESSVSFWLDVSINELVKRLIKPKKRPLLFKKNIRDTVYKIYLERKRTYNEADFRIRCNFLKPEVIVDKIVKYYEKSRSKI